MTNFRRSGLITNQPPLFTPVVVRGLTDDLGGSPRLERANLSTFSSSSIGLSASFRYDPATTGLKSTQQLNVDWSEFVNHTFFNSAQVKTNVAFQKIINEFPFDGTKQEYELFVDSLTGFEKYVLDSTPKNTGYLFFSGTNGETTGGTFVTTRDSAGVDFPTLTRTPDASSILNPGSNPFTIEFQLFLPPVSNSNQYVFDKHSTVTAGEDHGLSAYVECSGSVSGCMFGANVFSGSYVISASCYLEKDTFNHLAITWNRESGQNYLSIYKNLSLAATSSHINIGTLNFDDASLYIGSGSSTNYFASTDTLSGAMDEFRFWHSLRTPLELKSCQLKNIFSENNLKLYYKFNEPSGSNTRAVIDSSGNGLHGQISSFAYTNGIRNIPTSSVAGVSPITYEKLDYNPILFPDNTALNTLKSTLLTSASLFDEKNPSLITKLIPPHLLLAGKFEEALETEEGEIVTDITGSELPKSAQLGGTQLLLLLLYTWAKFFDEMKLFVQEFSNLRSVDYDDSEGTVADPFLQNMARHYGLELPSLFVGSSIEQFINAENTEVAYGNTSESLQYIQNQIWRRILINIKDIVSSKGTIHSVKAFIRTLGIDPDNNFRIREFGGPTKQTLKGVREKRSEVSSMLSFVSGGLIRSPYLSGSRTEPGNPTVAGTANDGLFTSGSWTFEGTYKLSNQVLETESLCRLCVTGSSGSLLATNLLATSGSGVSLYVSPGFISGASVPYLLLTLTGSDLFDSNIWNVSFGRERNDSFGSTTSSSYFLRFARANYGEIVEQYTTSSYFDDTTSCVWNELFDPLGNASGSFIEIGSASLVNINLMLNSSSLPSEAHETRFLGKLNQLRFWSKALSETEWKEHVRNFKSLGVTSPDMNFNFVTTESGSWERNRIDVSMDQETTSSDGSGNIELFDFSQNELHFSGTGFPSSYEVVVPQQFFYSYISPHFDEAATTNKVRVRSFQNFDNVLNDDYDYSSVAPVYELDASEEPQDNTKFSIDFSIADALNQDIINIFATLEELESAIGNPELMFSDDYPQLDVLRNVYFNRLTDKINLKTFFEFYKWFDTNIGMFISQLIPRKTKYLGTSFCVESHMLERPKFVYNFSDIYLGDSLRHGQRSTFLLQLFVGLFKRY